MNDTISALCHFFDREVPRLPHAYKWPIPQIKGFSQSGQSGYAPNIALKAYLKKMWDCSTVAEKPSVAKIIVSDWGGVRANSLGTLEGYVNAILKLPPPTPIKGVASYSKIFAIAFPDRYAIYDARVAACLNAVQINAGVKSGLAFNYVPGRNNVIGHSTKRIGFTQDARFASARLGRVGWERIERNQTYARYLELLNACMALRPGMKLTDLEMALFANAKAECKKAMDATPQP